MRRVAGFKRHRFIFNNILFTSQWDNYQAGWNSFKWFRIHIYLLMAGSTVPCKPLLMEEHRSCTSRTRMRYSYATRETGGQWAVIWLMGMHSQQGPYPTLRFYLKKESLDMAGELFNDKGFANVAIIGGSDGVDMPLNKSKALKSLTLKPWPTM